MLTTRWKSALVRTSIILAGGVLILRLTGCMEHLFYYPERGPTPLPPSLRNTGAQEVWFHSADGTRLHGWFVPARVRPESAPTILHAHGNAGNISSHIWFTEYLPPAGFNVFIFDYRGYGQSEGVARTRRPLIEDTEAALDAMLKRSDVDPNRIGMYGQSLGGSVGLNMMAKRTEIRAAVIESAFTSWRDMACDAVGGPVTRMLACALIPDSHRAVDAIAKVQRPILLVHGDADHIIPAEHSRRLADAAGPHAKLIILPGGDHNTLRESHPEIEQLVIDFYRKNL
jgi:dipeptidyl aminopeptidase/acylaminoacyl peptidase